MTVRKGQKGCRCERCGKPFISLMRLQHHIAAEHAPMISRDIHTTRDIPRRPKK